MKRLRSAIRSVQILENDAADRSGVMFMALDKARIGDAEYRKGWIERLFTAIGPQILDAAKAGKSLFAEVSK